MDFTKKSIYVIQKFEIKGNTNWRFKWLPSTLQFIEKGFFATYFNFKEN